MVVDEKAKVCNACLATLQNAYKCSACKSVYYCSKQCQRKNWKQHKKYCRMKQKSERCQEEEPQVLWAASQLNKLVSDISLDSAIETYQRAQDDIKSLKSNLKIRGGPAKIDSSIISTKGRDDLDSKSDDVSQRLDSNSSFVDFACENEHIADESSAWNYTVEKLIYVSSFNVTLTRSLDGQKDTSQFPEKENLDLTIEHAISKGKGGLRVIARSAQGSESLIASIILPEIIVSPEQEILSTLFIEDNIITFRLKYQQDGALLDAENEVAELSLKTTALTGVEALNNVKCSFCKQSLLQSTIPNGRNKDKIKEPHVEKEKVIKKSLHLPVGFWDEVVDYITCYEGQPAIDFSSCSMAPSRGISLEDDCILSLHKNDLKSVSVLAIEGYGEEDIDIANWRETDYETQRDATYRGTKEWQESVGGATVCCTFCCSTLGYASLENTDTIRLFKHKLEAEQFRVKEGACYSENAFESNTCGSFMAREIIRFAEAQAIFTFVVIQKMSGIKKGQKQKCLLLKLLSWNTLLAKKCEETPQDLDLRRVAKMIYEESDLFMNNNPSGNDDSDVLVWGGADLCCEPFVLTRDLSEKIEPTTSEASVRIYLSVGDWEALKEELIQGSKYFTNSLTRATTQIKLGKNGERRKGGAALSMLQLP